MSNGTLRMANTETGDIDPVDPGSILQLSEMCEPSRRDGHYSIDLNLVVLKFYYSLSFVPRTATSRTFYEIRYSHDVRIQSRHFTSLEKR